MQPQHQQQQSVSEKKSNKRGLDMLISAVEEVRLARRDLGWGVDELAMRLTMLSFLRSRNTGRAGRIPREVKSSVSMVSAQQTVARETPGFVDRVTQ